MATFTQGAPLLKYVNSRCDDADSESFFENCKSPNIFSMRPSEWTENNLEDYLMHVIHNNKLKHPKLKRITKKFNIYSYGNPKLVCEFEHMDEIVTLHMNSTLMYSVERYRNKVVPILLRDDNKKARSNA